MADARLDALVEAARAARTRAYAPYCGFAVGAAALGGDRIFTGGNVENASFPVSVCAERNAVAAMLDGGQQRLDAVAIVTDAAAPAPPCGACRQVLWEFGPSALVVSETLARRASRVALERSPPRPVRARPAVSSPAGFRSGIVAVVGRPNVGKSTLVNALVGQKVAIVSNKPQTTQRDIRAIWNTEGAQIVFTDTPGYPQAQDPARRSSERPRRRRGRRRRPHRAGRRRRRRHRFAATPSSIARRSRPPARRRSAS